TRYLFAVERKQVFTIIALIFFSAFQSSDNAQTVHGKVADEKGKPVHAASVTVKGTSRGSTTNDNGSFSISAAASDVLVISSVGFTTQEVAVGNQSNISISLTSTNSQLEQVIVVGYGTQKRKNVTGAFSTVNNKTLNEVPVVSLQ